MTTNIVTPITSALRFHRFAALFLLAGSLPLAAQQMSDFVGFWSPARGGGGARGRGADMTEWGSVELPLTEEGRAQLEANLPGKGPRAVPPALGNDLVGGANPPGLYRTLVYNRPFEILASNGKLVQIFEWGKTWRYIWTDGREAPEELIAGPYWYGYSTAKWDGDTLVVTTMGLDERAWMDEWGTPYSSEARFEERWKRVEGDRLELVITVHDPVYYTEPWTTDPRYFALDPKGELDEMIFAPVDEEIFNRRVRDPAAGVYEGDKK